MASKTKRKPVDPFEHPFLDYPLHRAQFLAGVARVTHVFSGKIFIVLLGGNKLISSFTVTGRMPREWKAILSRSEEGIKVLERFIRAEGKFKGRRVPHEAAEEESVVDPDFLKKTIPARKVFDFFRMAGLREPSLIAQILGIDSRDVLYLKKGRDNLNGPHLQKLFKHGVNPELLRDYAV